MNTVKEKTGRTKTIAIAEKGLDAPRGVLVRFDPDREPSPYIEGTSIYAGTSSKTPITREEFELMREAVPIYANLPGRIEGEDPRKTRLPKLGARWRALVKGLDIASSRRMAMRLVETYAVAYPSLEQEHKVDSWGGSESHSNLLTICFAFAADEDERWAFAREAMDAFDEPW